MIDQLACTNIGVIERAELSFGPGLSVITGETGAGKTMLLTAIGLIAGDRADASRVRAGAERATVDATICDPDDPAALAALAERVDGELDDGALLVSRSVPASGRARASLGGRPVPAGVLAELAERYVTIHGQAEQLKLRRASHQRAILDAYGGEKVAAARTQYIAAFDAAREAAELLAKLNESSTERAQRAAALRAGIAAIEEVDPKAGEDDELKARAERLTNIDELRRGVETAYAHLGAREDAATAQLAEAERALSGASHVDESLAPLLDQLAESATVIADVASQLSGYLGDLDVAPGELDQIHARRAAITQLLRVYGPEITDALAWRDDAARELTELDDSPEALAAARAAAEQTAAALTKAATALRQARRAAAQELGAAITAELADLAMPNARVRIRVEEIEPARHGADEIAFELAAHTGADFLPITQGASGGELSRLMLALEVCIAASQPARTFVFDEIDAGIGGETATRVGKRLARLAAHHQVIVVTHVAQVAAFAAGHIVIEKHDGATVRTTARAVEGDQRVAEVARMLGGTDTDVALTHAAELIAAAS